MGAKKYTNNKKFTNGFTLIELLVVISIVGLLSTVILSNLNTARVKAEDAKKQILVRQYYEAFQQYLLYNDGNLPPIVPDADGNGTDLTGRIIPLFVAQGILPNTSMATEITNNFIVYIWKNYTTPAPVSVGEVNNRNARIAGCGNSPEAKGMVIFWFKTGMSASQFYRQVPSWSGANAFCFY